MEETLEDYVKRYLEWKRIPTLDTSGEIKPSLMNKRERVMEFITQGALYKFRIKRAEFEAEVRKHEKDLEFLDKAVK